MESITIRVDKEFAKEIEKAMKPDYSTKTEFIRDAIRAKLKSIRRDEELRKYLGAAKRTTTYEEERKAREIATEKIFRKHGIDLE